MARRIGCVDGCCALGCDRGHDAANGNDRDGAHRGDRRVGLESEIGHDDR